MVTDIDGGVLGAPEAAPEDRHYRTRADPPERQLVIDAADTVFRHSQAAADPVILLTEFAAGVSGLRAPYSSEVREPRAAIYGCSPVGGDPVEWMAVALDRESFVFAGVAGGAHTPQALAAQRNGRLADFLADYVSQGDERAEREATARPNGVPRCCGYSKLLDHLRDAVVVMDVNGRVTAWNLGAERLFAYSAAEMLGMSIAVVDAEAEHSLLEAVVHRSGHERTVRCRKKSGETFWGSATLAVARDDTGQAIGVVSQVVDISSQLAAAEKLGLYAAILERNNEAVLVADATKHILSSNAAFTTMTGYLESEVLGQPLSMLFGDDSEVLLYDEILSEVTQGDQWCGELQFRRKNGDPFPGRSVLGSVSDGDGRLSHYFLVFSDISERKDAESQIHRLAYYDSLTALPNRALFQLLLDQSLSELHRKRGHGALLHVDLNRFKQINDSFGHTQADAILTEVSRRITATLREEDFVARLSADEFIIALPNIHRRVYAGYVARKVLAALAEPFFLGQHELLLSASMGISIFPEDGANTETLLRNASVARYRAKKSGSNSYVFYSQEMNLRSLEQLKLEGGLRRASERGEFQLLYQPQLNLASGRISGAEALLRWHHPESGLILPAEFIPLAEETGLIEPIGQWVINAACSQIRAWRDLHLPDVRVAVNLSARQFTAKLPAKIVAALGEHGIPHEALELEITESMLMNSSDSVVSMMHEFGDAGLRLTLDDFGTGYSSLSYLKRLPVDNLKIDQSFVRGIPTDVDDSAIARAIIGMARNLRMSVIAEGVETAAQMKFLQMEGCEDIQGFHFSHPLLPQEFAELLMRING